MARLWLSLGALYGLLGVAFGAFGAHALKNRLGSEALALYHTAVQYQFFHTTALLAIGLLAQRAPSAALDWAGSAFALGILLFSGSLYLLALTGARGLGAVTPVGGVLFLVGWAALLYAALKAAA